MEHEPDDDSPLLHSTRLPAAPAAPRPAGGDRSSGEDLREALDQLRAELDGDRRPRPAPEPAPVAAPATSGGRRRSGQVALVALAAVAALAACAGIVRVVAWSTSGPVPPSAAAPRVPSPPAGAPQPS
ncbi:MAG TPA: hypothetical protein VE781_05685, partial [Kineosporiaceae bacterium]|nr:hypothetical protein [Kineosporiaceae bacterium]